MYCDRPTERAVDFGATRFVVSGSYGLTINGGRLERGSEVPKGALEPRFLRLEYRARRIETVDHAKTDPDLRAACARAGVDLDSAPPHQSNTAPKISEDFDKLSRAQLAALCEKHGIAATGSNKEIRDRLTALVG